MNDKNQNEDENVTLENGDAISDADETTHARGESGGEGEMEPPEQELAAAEEVVYADEELKPLIESLLFAYGEPLSSQRIAEIAKVDEQIVDGILLELLDESRAPDSGIELVRVAEKYQYRTKGRFASAIRVLKAGKPRRLSGAALETLAIVAYRQPVVKSDIEKIRGVDVTPTLKTLMERNFVRIVGHQSTVGQPALYGTTDEFLKIFGLNSLSELPSLRDLAEFDFDPGESEESLPATEEAQVVTQ